MREPGAGAVGCRTRRGESRGAAEGKGIASARRKSAAIFQDIQTRDAGAARHPQEHCSRALSLSRESPESVAELPPARSTVPCTCATLFAGSRKLLGQRQWARMARHAAPWASHWARPWLTLQGHTQSRAHGPRLALESVRRSRGLREDWRTRGMFDAPRPSLNNAGGPFNYDPTRRGNGPGKATRTASCRAKNHVDSSYGEASCQHASSSPPFAGGLPVGGLTRGIWPACNNKLFQATKAKKVNQAIKVKAQHG